MRGLCGGGAGILAHIAHGCLPALKKSLALLLDELRHEGLGCFCKGAHLCGALGDGFGQSGSLLRTCCHQAGDGLIKQCLDSLGNGGVDEVAATAHLHDLRDGEWRRRMEHGADGSLGVQQTLQRALIRDGLGTVVLTLYPSANLDFSALELLGDAFAQRGLCVAQLIADSEAQVKKPAVHGPDFEPNTHLLADTGCGALRGG